MAETEITLMAARIPKALYQQLRREAATRTDADGVLLRQQGIIRLALEKLFAQWNQEDTAENASRKPNCPLTRLSS